MKHLLRLVSIALISGFLGAAVIRLEDFSWLRSDDALFDQTFLEIANRPLLAAVFEDYPEKKNEFRATLRKIYETSEPNDTRDRTRLATDAIVAQYAAPMIAQADDASSIDVMRAGAAVVDALAQYHTGGCQGILTGDLANAPAIPQVMQALDEFWRAQSIAYVSGKEKRIKTTLSSEEFVDIITDDLGLTEDEFAAVATAKDNPDQDLCGAVKKLFRIDLVPIETRAIYARAFFAPEET